MPYPPLYNPHSALHTHRALSCREPTALPVKPRALTSVGSAGAGAHPRLWGDRGASYLGVCLGSAHKRVLCVLAEVYQVVALDQRVALQRLPKPVRPPTPNDVFSSAKTPRCIILASICALIPWRINSLHSSPTSQWFLLVSRADRPSFGPVPSRVGITVLRETRQKQTANLHSLPRPSCLRI